MFLRGRQAKSDDALLKDNKDKNKNSMFSWNNVKDS